MGAVLIGERYAYGVAVRTVGVGMRLRGVGRIADKAFSRPVAPINGVGADGISTRIGDGTEVQHIRRALSDVAISRERDRRGDIVDSVSKGSARGSAFIIGRGDSYRYWADRTVVRIG